ncbi:MAG: serine/threonine-protein kinase [Polyangiaceae bacterium]
MQPTKREGIGPPPEAAARFEPVAGAIVADKYRIERVLGEGGMGVVVLATHMALEQPVAIKFLLPEALRSKIAVERFLREARVAAKIRNDHVARVHDVGTIEGGVPYIVMEYLVGSDLGDLIAEAGALPIDEACEITLQACEALSEVHAAGIVHRDLKPSNLFITRRADGAPSVKLLDFGISKLILGPDEGGVDPALTSTTMIMGSPSYMSPEQLKSTKEVDPRADIWSLGAVLYEAIAGKPAFRGESVPQVCAMIASEDPHPLSTYREGVPRDLDRAVQACLEKNAAKRITLVDLAQVLARFAPDRAKPSLERLEAVVGSPRSRADPVSARIALPVLPLATAESTRTAAAWGKDRRGRGAGGAAVVLVVLGVLGAIAVAIGTGRVSVARLGGDIAGASHRVTSAAGAVTSAAGAVTSAVSSAVASSIPDVPLPTFDTPSSSADSDDSEDDPDAQVSALTVSDAGHPASAAATGAHPAPSKVHPPAKTRHPARVRHHHI